MDQGEKGVEKLSCKGEIERRRKFNTGRDEDRNPTKAEL